MNITDIIGIPLGALLGWCYQLLGNYGLAIIVFTFLTKVILFPVLPLGITALSVPEAW